MGGSVTLLRPDGSQFPGSPFTGGGLPAPFAAVVDGNDNVWVTNFGDAGEPDRASVRGANRELPARPEDRRPNLAAGRLRGRRPAKVDRFGVDPAGDVWVMNNWNVMDSCFLKPARTKRFPRVAAATVSRSSTAWRSRCAHRKSVRLGSRSAVSSHQADRAGKFLGGDVPLLRENWSAVEA